MKKNRKHKGKLYIDLRKTLPRKANPLRWEAPTDKMPNHLFFKVRWVHCLFYRRCMDYSAGLHWEGWSCNWCVYNPYGEKFDEKNADRATKVIWKINRARAKRSRTAQDI